MVFELWLVVPSHDGLKWNDLIVIHRYVKPKYLNTIKNYCCEIKLMLYMYKKYICSANLKLYLMLVCTYNLPTYVCNRSLCYLRYWWWIQYSIIWCLQEWYFTINVVLMKCICNIINTYSNFIWTQLFIL